MPEPMTAPADVRLVDGRPRAFRWQGNPYVVTRIVGSWPSGAQWWRRDHPASGNRPELPHWLVEAVGPGGAVGRYDVRIDPHGATLVAAHGETPAA